MPGGVLEERLRGWVAERLEKPGEATPRGRATRLAGYLSRPAEWVSMYKAGKRDADFDTTLRILELFNVSLDDLKRDALPSEIELQIWETIRELPAPQKRFVLTVAQELKAGKKLVVGTQPVPEPAHDAALGARKSSRRG